MTSIKNILNLPTENLSSIVKILTDEIDNRRRREGLEMKLAKALNFGDDMCECPEKKSECLFHGEFFCNCPCHEVDDSYDSSEESSDEYFCIETSIPTPYIVRPFKSHTPYFFSSYRSVCNDCIYFKVGTYVFIVKSIPAAGTYIFDLDNWKVWAKWEWVYNLVEPLEESDIKYIHSITDYGGDPIGICEDALPARGKIMRRIQQYNKDISSIVRRDEEIYS